MRATRSRSFWRCIKRGFWTLAFEVAKWLCQNSVIRSRSGCGVKIIRYSQMRLDPRQIGRWLRARRPSRRGSIRTRRPACRRRSCASPFKSAVDAGGRPVAQVALEDRPAGGESRAAVQVRHAAPGPTAASADGSNGFQAQAADRPSRALCDALSSADCLSVSFRELELQLDACDGRVIADDEPAMAEVAQERQTQLDLLLSAFSLVSPRLSMSCIASRLRLISSSRASSGPSASRTAVSATSAPTLLDFSSLIRSRARPTLELKIRYLPTWAVAGVKLYRGVGGRRGCPGLPGTDVAGGRQLDALDLLRPELQRGGLFLIAVDVRDADDRLEGDLEPFAEIGVGRVELGDDRRRRDI